MTNLSRVFFSLLVVVVISGLAPVFGQTDMTGQIIGGKIGSLAKASDGTTVLVVTSHPISGQALAIGIGFKNSNGNFVQHQNYAITVTQNNEIILSDPKGHTHTGTDNQITSVLSSDNPVNISITLNGIGLPTADPSTWTGVKGETLTFSHVSDMSTPMSNMTMPAGNATVPEFGPVASIVLAIAVLSVVVFAAKTRVIPRL